MKKNFHYSIFIGVFLISCANFGDTLVYYNKGAKISKIKTVLYFNPEIYPNIPEIGKPTYSAFHTAVSDKMKSFGNLKYLQIDTSISFDNADENIIKELCKNNNTELAVVPKVKYFKVGFGKYVFSNQVIVSLKLYNAKGNLIMQTAYDTYSGNARLLGTAETSVIIGTKGAIQKMSKELRKKQILKLAER